MDKLTVSDFKKSTRKNKKYMVTIPASIWNKERPDKIERQKTVHFGDKRYEQYKDKIGLYSNLDHLDKNRRDEYRNRHEGVLLKNGQKAYKKKFSPSWFSYYYLW